MVVIGKRVRRVECIQCDCKDQARWGNLDDIISDFWIDNYCGSYSITYDNNVMEIKIQPVSLCARIEHRISRLYSFDRVRDCRARSLETPAAGKVWCVCPNGRAMARQLKTKGPKS